MGNILGEKFDGYIQNQIKVRQESLGKYTNISTKDLMYYQNKTPWLRLASSVDLEVMGDNSNLEKLSKLLKGVDSNNLKDSNLAKKCILYGGVVDESNPQPQSGLRSKNDSIFSGAYGWGGGERGFVPQPGIIGADVTYYNNGALSKTTLNIKCFSREQFAIIDALYMRPGYTVLLEFGWSLYLSKNKNNNNIELNSFDQFQSSALRKFLNGEVKDNFDIYKLIEDDRKTYNGNYNGVYGKISKFDWAFNNDGSYDITIQITGMGDIIESLTIPSLISDKQENEEGQIVVSESKLKSKFHNKLEDYRKLTSELMRGYPNALLMISNTNTPLSTPLTINNFNKEKNNITIPHALFQVSGGRRDNSTGIFREDYISFGALIATIQNLFLLYNKDQSIYGFDMNFDDLSKDENFIIRLPLQFSSDPTKVLIPVDEEFKVEISPGVSSVFQLLDDKNKTPTNIASLLKGNYLVYDKEITEKEKTQGKKQLSTDYFMLLSSVYVNMNYVEELLNTYNDPSKNEIELLGIIKDILTSINSCTGNINNLDIKLDNDIGLYRFKNSTPFMLNILPEETTSKFNLFGFLPKNNQGDTSTPIQGSFIRDVSLTSGITDEWATLISIGAASNSSSNFTDSTSFKLYNKGLKDRILPERNDKVNQFLKDSLQKNLKKGLKEMEDYYDLIYNENNFNESTISTLKSKYSTVSGYLKEYYFNKLNANISFFLPFNLKLTMDGIGGIKLYQRFEMDERILPPMYDDKQIDLIVNGINHSITPSGWTTTLDSLSVPKSTAQ